MSLAGVNDLHIITGGLELLTGSPHIITDGLDLLTGVLHIIIGGLQLLYTGHQVIERWCV